MTIWGSYRSHRLHDWFDLQSSDGGGWQQELAEIEDTRGEAFGFQLDNVAAWVEGGDHILPSARDALAVQELVEAMLAGG
jgi:predicted dehydrogenase